jgi:hypothetical protein
MHWALMKKGAIVFAHESYAMMIVKAFDIQAAGKHGNGRVRMLNGHYTKQISDLEFKEWQAKQGGADGDRPISE